jgi:malate dehydrogenase
MTSKIITITGAAGRIAYSLIPLILNGNVFGPHCDIHLRLLDIPESEAKLKGVQMEIEDSFYPLLKSLVATSNRRDAFLDADVVVLVGGFPRLPGMERRDLLIKNAESIKSQAEALNEYGSAHAKVLVVANPANTNCLVAIKAATRIPPENFTCLTRLDQERLRGFCAKQLTASLQRTVFAKDVHDVYILGNHSTTQVAFVHQGQLVENDHTVTRVAQHFTSEEYVQLLRKVQNRGAEIIKVLQVSSALSAAEAIVRHLADWLGPTIPAHPFSMGVLIKKGNAYGIPEDIVFSLPCNRSDNDAGYVPLDGLTFDEATQSLVVLSADELTQERLQILEYL